MSANQATSHPVTVDTDKSVLDNMLCPACNNADAVLVKHTSYLKCDKCEIEFPIFTCGDVEIPWVYQQPEVQLLEWQARLKGYLYINQCEQDKLKQGLNDKRLSKANQKRIRNLLAARKQLQEQVLELMQPLDLDREAMNASEIISNQQSKTPKVQGLGSYYDNIFRDWCWDNGENEQMLEAVESVLSEDTCLGKALTIGSGAGRLSYDMHCKYSAEYSLLMDINPLLMFASSNVIQGKVISLNEFPIAPLNKQSFFATQTCKAPRAIKDNFHYMFADGMNPPFKSASFDTVITPWLLDIIPQNLRDYIPRINQCLPIGGHWINTGSLAFFHHQAAWCYSEEEVIELLEKNGFELLSSSRRTIRYMKSPLSAHGRSEEVFSFNAKKVKQMEVHSKYEYLPEWIRDTNETIPKNSEFELGSSKHLLQAQVLGAIDGTRSIEQIGELVAKQYNLRIDESVNAVRQIMIDTYETN